MPGVVTVGVSDAPVPLAGVAWAVEPISTISLNSLGEIVQGLYLEIITYPLRKANYH
jgi:hypothetical protein